MRKKRLVHTPLTDFWEMSKPGICFLAIVMAAFGYSLGGGMQLPWYHLVILLAALWMLGASSGILNHYLERDIDGLMNRTSDRPLPTGRIRADLALIIGVILGIGGVALLFGGINVVTGALGLMTAVSYLFIYTPLKRVTSLSTLVGAVPGALPPLMGWTAATGSVALEGIILFSVLFLWQIPHFLALAWLYREDYGRAGLPVLPVIDADGRFFSWQVLLYSLALIPLTLFPSIVGTTGKFYFAGALVLGLIFAAMSYRLFREITASNARRVFFASLLYLPLLGLFMICDRRF